MKVVTKIKLFGILFMVFLLIGASTWFGRSFWLPLIGEALVEDDSPKLGADIILIMMGAPAERAPKALKLFKDGYAPLLGFVRPEDFEVNRITDAPNEGDIVDRFLKINGVPDHARKFYFDSAVTSTWDEVAVLLKHVEALNPRPRRIIVVTSWYHSKRVSWVFERLKPAELFVELSPVGESDAATWWQTEKTFLPVFNEYLKWLYYLKNY